MPLWVGKVAQFFLSHKYKNNQLKVTLVLVSMLIFPPSFLLVKCISLCLYFIFANVFLTDYQNMRILLIGLCTFYLSTGRVISYTVCNINIIMCIKHKMQSYHVFKHFFHSGCWCRSNRGWISFRNQWL